MDNLELKVRVRLMEFRYETVYPSEPVRPWHEERFSKYKKRYHPFLHNNWLYFRLSDRRLLKTYNRRMGLARATDLPVFKDKLTDAELEYVWSPLTCVAFEMHRRKLQLVLNDILSCRRFISQCVYSCVKVKHWLAKGQCPDGDTKYYYLDPPAFPNPEELSASEAKPEASPDEKPVSRHDEIVKSINEKEKQPTSPFDQLLPNMEKVRIVDGKRKRTIFRQINPDPEFQPTKENLEKTFGRDLASKGDKKLLTFIARFRALEVPVELTDSSNNSSPRAPPEKYAKLFSGEKLKKEHDKKAGRQEIIQNESEDKIEEVNKNESENIDKRESSNAAGDGFNFPETTKDTISTIPEDPFAIFRKTEPIMDIPKFSEKIEKRKLKKAMEEAEKALKAKENTQSNSQEPMENYNEPILSAPRETKYNSISPFTVASAIKHALEVTNVKDSKIDHPKDLDEPSIADTIGKALEITIENEQSNHNIFKDTDENYIENNNIFGFNPNTYDYLDALTHTISVASDASFDEYYEVDDTVGTSENVEIDGSASQGGYLQPGLYEVPSTETSSHIKQHELPKPKLSKPLLDPGEEKIRKMYPNLAPEYYKAGPSGLNNKRTKDPIDPYEDKVRKMYPNLAPEYYEAGPSGLNKRTKDSIDPDEEKVRKMYPNLAPEFYKAGPSGLNNKHTKDPIEAYREKVRKMYPNLATEYYEPGPSGLNNKRTKDPYEEKVRKMYPNLIPEFYEAGPSGLNKHTKDSIGPFKGKGKKNRPKLSAKYHQPRLSKRPPSPPPPSANFSPRAGDETNKSTFSHGKSNQYRQMCVKELAPERNQSRTYLSDPSLPPAFVTSENDNSNSDGSLETKGSSVYYSVSNTTLNSDDEYQNDILQRKCSCRMLEDEEPPEDFWAVSPRLLEEEPDQEELDFSIPDPDWLIPFMQSGLPIFPPDDSEDDED